VLRNEPSRCANRDLMRRSKKHRYSITVGASDGRRRYVEPERLCRLEFDDSSNLTGARTGSSLGFVPLRIRST
jgi:hypothetical protein